MEKTDALAETEKTGRMEKTESADQEAKNDNQEWQS
jgi:hypothetical protein